MSSYPLRVQESLEPGLAGTNRTLEWMAALVRRDSKDLELRHLALGLARHCGGHQFACERESLFTFVRDEITYRRDTVDREHVQDSRRTLGYRTGDCGSKVVLLASLLAAIGHRSRFVVLGDDPSRFSHVYLEVFTERGWLALDPTPEVSPIGWRPEGAVKLRYPIWRDGPSVGGPPLDETAACTPGTFVTLQSGERAYCRAEESITVRATSDNTDWSRWLVGGAAVLFFFALLTRR